MTSILVHTNPNENPKRKMPPHQPFSDRMKDGAQPAATASPRRARDERAHVSGSRARALLPDRTRLPREPRAIPQSNTIPPFILSAVAVSLTASAFPAPTTTATPPPPLASARPSPSHYARGGCGVRGGGGAAVSGGGQRDGGVPAQEGEGRALWMSIDAEMEIDAQDEMSRCVRDLVCVRWVRAHNGTLFIFVNSTFSHLSLVVPEPTTEVM